MRILAPAKINLGLEIIRKRADGYHDINSIFLSIALCDELEIIADATLSMTCDDAALPVDESNLCIRAARMMQERFDCRDRGARITLHKNIPMGAGLGGGSSDAAAVIRALNDVWGINASIEELAKVAAEIGSDVPFFLYGQPMLARGRGDVMAPIEFPLKSHIVLVCPSVHVSTPWAYKALDITSERRATPYEKIIPQLANLGSLRELCVNDFERVVFTEHPELALIKEKLLHAGAAYASMSGSGSAVYGMFETAEAAKNAAKIFVAMRAELLQIEN
jgi:4-diphosphocytidyl-2-C-methyl-D-erythritol kinase